MAQASDLTMYGAFGYYLLGMAGTGAVLGALIGWTLAKDAGDGAAIGMALGMVSCVVVVVLSRRRLSEYSSRHSGAPAPDVPNAGDSGGP